MEWLVESLPVVSIGAGVLGAFLKGVFTDELSRHDLFRNATNLSAIIVLVPLLSSIWFYPDYAKRIIVEHRFVVTWGVIFALYDNVTGFFDFIPAPSLAKRSGGDKD